MLVSITYILYVKLLWDALNTNLVTNLNKNQDETYEELPNMKNVTVLSDTILVLLTISDENVSENKKDILLKAIRDNLGKYKKVGSKVDKSLNYHQLLLAILLS